MHVQIKTEVAPPEKMCARCDGWAIHDDFRAKQHGNKWVYESSRLNATEFAVPEWIYEASLKSDDTFVIHSHDMEIYKQNTATIICSTNGKPLSPYYIPMKHVPNMPDACFSLPFKYMRISIHGALHYVTIQRIEPQLQSLSGGPVATLQAFTVFEGPVGAETAYCKTCREEFDLYTGEMPLHIDHMIVPSRFSVPHDINSIYDKAIRAAFKKAKGAKPSKACFVYVAKEEDGGS